MIQAFVSLNASRRLVKLVRHESDTLVALLQTRARPDIK